MKFLKFLIVTWFLLLVGALYPSTSSAWFDETHLVITKVAGYEKWFNAAGPDVAKIKRGDKEGAESPTISIDSHANYSLKPISGPRNQISISQSLYALRKLKTVASSSSSKWFHKIQRIGDWLELGFFYEDSLSP
jgi:hypothetical protein